MSENIQSISQGTFTIGQTSANDSSLLVTKNENNVSILSTQQEISHDNTLSGNGTVDSPLGVTSGYIQMLSVNQPFTANSQNYVSTASVPDGYEFLCWVNMCTNGFSEIFYPLSPTTTACTWWLGGSNSKPSAGNSVDSRYLVIKKA